MKIYVNETPLILWDSRKHPELPEATRDILVARYTGKPPTLFNYVDSLEKSRRFRKVVLYSDDFEALQAAFMAHFKLIHAGGGLVFNPENELLVLFRRGFWDLPKGKQDVGETIESTAVREVKEETGLSEVRLGPFIADTFHTYRVPNGRVLKRTSWFRMEAPTAELLRPQAEEDIEIARWQDARAFLEQESPIYSNIRAVIQLALGEQAG